MQLNSPVPPDEIERLRALEALGILDTPREVSFDDITRIAASICECPMSAVTFVDEKRQWFKSTYGLKATEAPRDGGFCAHAIMVPDVFVVEDARKDPRFVDHPFVKGPPFIRFYAAVPVKSDGGHNVGVVCVMDSRPRALTAAQTEAMRGFARLVATLLKGRGLALDQQTTARLKMDADRLVTECAHSSMLGSVVTSVAHEVNNPLTIVTMLTEKLKSAGPEREGEREALASRIQAAVGRIADSIRLLNGFAQGPENESYGIHRFSRLVEQALLLSRKSLDGRGIEVRVGTVPEGLILECRPHQVVQVLFSLITNAADAVADLQGTREKWIEISVAEQDTTVLVTVRDSGFGLPSEVRARVFQPMFTTKQTKKRIGLGLSVSKKIVESHGGKIWVEADNDRTRFDFSLPKRRRSSGGSQAQASV